VSTFVCTGDIEIIKHIDIFDHGGIPKEQLQIYGFEINTFNNLFQEDSI
jgi:hypothetical protein